MRSHQGAVFKVGRGGDQPGYFASTERFGQPPGAFDGDAKMEIGLSEDMPIEEVDSGDLLVAGAVGIISHGDHVMNEVTDLVDGNLVGRAVIVLGQLFDGGNISVDGAAGFAMQPQNADHLLAQRRSRTIGR